MSDTFDQFTTSVQIRASKPLTQKQWERIHKLLRDSFERAIDKSGAVSPQIESVHMESPFNTWGQRIDRTLGRLP